MLDDSPASVFEPAELSNVDFVTFDDFRCGRIELPAAAFERVARRLGFTRMRTSKRLALVLIRKPGCV